MALSLCSTSVTNTGELACDKSKGVLQKLFLFNGSIAEADYTTAQELFDKLVANSKLSKSDANKIFVLNEVQDIARNSESNTEGTLGLGFKTIIREGRPAYTAKIFGGADLLSRLRTFNNQTVRILEYDANGVVWGTLSGTDFKGYQAKIFFSGGEIATGQNVEEGVIDVQVSILSVSEYKNNPVYVAIPDTANIEDVVPLVDVTMAFVSNSSNVHQISMKIAGANLIEDYNIYDDYMDAIDALTFTAQSGVGTTPISLPITSIVKNATLSTLAVTYDNTAYGTAVSNLKLIPPTPATLDAADVTGIELLPLTYAKP
jgi:hypothetical protein